MDRSAANGKHGVLLWVSSTTFSAVLLHALASSTVLAASGTGCPGGTFLIDSFEIEGKAWRACEDVQVPDGALVLISAEGQEEWFPKSYSLYGSANDQVCLPFTVCLSLYLPLILSAFHRVSLTLVCPLQDPRFYLGLGKQNVTGSKMDLLGITMLTQPEITWDLVADAVPIIKGADVSHTDTR